MKNSDQQLHALIYNRVSSLQQERDGSGLSSQEHRCIQYAKSKGYIIYDTTIFHDKYTGGGDFMKRPAMRELLNYIDSNPGKNYVVIFDDLKRFARDTIFHFQLKSAFHIRKTIVECLNFNFEDTPEGHFVETVFAAQNQLEREQNQRQVIQKQRARLESGYWAFHSKRGYTMKRNHGSNGKVSTLNDDSPYIKEALEGFANYRFLHVTDVVRFLKEKKILGMAHSDKYIQPVKEMLQDCFYIGNIEFKPWNISMRKGMHEPLIDDDTYYKNIARLQKSERITKVRVDDNPEFEVRRLYSCMGCKRPLTGSFSKGRSQLYAYYFCQSKNCKLYRISIPREKIHNDYYNVLKRLSPKTEVIDMFINLFEECWANAISEYNGKQSNYLQNIDKLSEESDRYLTLIGKCNNELVRSKYEDRIEVIEREIQLIKQKSVLKIDFSAPYRTALNKVLTTAKNPLQAWALATQTERKKLFYFFFEDNIEYDLNNNYRTVKPSILYRYLYNLSQNTGDVDKRLNLSNHFIELWEFISKWSMSP